MSTRKWVDKKKANTYNLVHRSHDDPLNYDNEAAPSVLLQVDNLNTKEQKQQRKDKWNKNIDRSGFVLTESDAKGRRPNEGEAALYGITYDDSTYDYMQHLKPMGSDPTAVFLAKKDAEKRSAKKGADLMLKSTYASVNEAQAPSIAFPKDMLPPEEHLETTYQNQQDIPDEIAGFQPDMDPELRQVLEALEDEEYVENENEDFFGGLVASGKAVADTTNLGQKDEWDDYDDYEDNVDALLALSDDDGPGVGGHVVEKKEDEEDWETAFRQFKLDQELSKKQAAYNTDDEEDGDGIASLGGHTTMTHAVGGQNKKKKKKRFGGAMTELSGVSMSSSAIHRNKGLTLLDDRFDKIEEDYEAGSEEELEAAHQAFDLKNERPDLESIMDDFLDNYAIEGKKLIKKKDLRR